MNPLNDQQRQNNRARPNLPRPQGNQNNRFALTPQEKQRHYRQKFLASISGYILRTCLMLSLKSSSTLHSISPEDKSGIFNRHNLIHQSLYFASIAQAGHTAMLADLMPEEQNAYYYIFIPSFFFNILFNRINQNQINNEENEGTVDYALCLFIFILYAKVYSRFIDYILDKVPSRRQP